MPLPYHAWPNLTGPRLTMPCPAALRALHKFDLVQGSLPYRTKPRPAIPSPVWPCRDACPQTL